MIIGQANDERGVNCSTMHLVHDYIFLVSEMTHPFMIISPLVSHFLHTQHIQKYSGIYNLITDVVLL